MDFSMASLFEWTKLFVRNPALAASLVKEAKLPIEVSILMIVLAGVISAAASGTHYLLIGAPDIIFPISETQGLKVDRIGPIGQGIYAVISGIGLGYIIHWVGARLDGDATLADIMGIMAVLQLVTTLIFAAVYAADLILPIVGLVLMLIGFYVSIRGLGHAVNVGHGYENMLKAAGIGFLALVLLAFALIMGTTLSGLAPAGQIVPLPEDMML